MGEGRNLVGVDIGSTSIKVCQLKETRRGLSLMRFGYQQLSPQVIVDGQIMDSGVVVERGRHGALIAAGGLYADLWRRQAEEPDALDALGQEGLSAAR